MASVAIVYRKDKLNKKGEAPIHFRIIKDRKISYITSGKMLHQHFWNSEKNCVKTNFKNSLRLNNYLLEKWREINDAVIETETNFKSVTSSQLKESAFGKIPTDFFVFAEKEINKYLEEGKIGTYDRSLSVITKLRNYWGDKKLFFHEINHDFLEKYESHLRTYHLNKTNTIHMNLKFFRKLFNDAYRQELIEHNQNPFLKYRLKQEKTLRVYLTEEELLKIENLSFTKGDKTALYRDMFVFAAYSGGLRVSDILQLKWKNFDGKHIHFNIRKTGGQISIKLPNKALSILKKYKVKQAKPDNFIFSMLPPNLNFENLREVDSAISLATALINKNLKTISSIAKINKHISFHSSRHTFATRALTKGISIDKVSKLMGHAAIKETQVYAKIVSEELDKAMEVFNT